MPGFNDGGYNESELTVTGTFGAAVSEIPPGTVTTGASTFNDGGFNEGYLLVTGTFPEAVNEIPPGTKATIISIADAVTDALNATSLSLAFTATRVYVPTYLQDELQALKVQVVPSMLNGKIIDRSGRNLYDYKIYVGVQKLIGSGPMTDEEINAICDPLMLLAEEIGNVFDGKPLAGSSPGALRRRGE